MTSLAKTKSPSLGTLLDPFSWFPMKWEYLTKNWFGEDIWTDLMNENTATNIYETNENYVIEYQKPGIPQEKWDVEVKDNKIFIKAENTIENEEKDEEKKYYRKSMKSVSINESYRLPQNVDESNISAVYTDGVLKISIPKTEPTREEAVKVEIAAK